MHFLMLPKVRSSPVYSDLYWRLGGTAARIEVDTVWQWNSLLWIWILDGFTHLLHYTVFLHCIRYDYFTYRQRNMQKFLKLDLLKLKKKYYEDMISFFSFFFILFIGCINPLVQLTKLSGKSLRF